MRALATRAAVAATQVSALPASPSHIRGIDSAVVSSMQRLSKGLSIGVAALGVLVLAGWIFDVGVLKSLGPSFATMKANTAALFVLLGAGLWWSRDERAAQLRSGLALVVGAVAALTLAEYALGRDLGIDQILLRDPVRSDAPGRMAPVTALNFLLLGLAVFRLGRGTRRASDAAAVVAAGLSFLALCGYFYGASELYQLAPNTSIALHTSVGFLAAALAFFSARPAEGTAALLASDTTAGKLLRRTLPLVACVPLSLAWLLPREVQFDSQQEGVLRIALLNAAATSILGAALFLITSSLHRSELERRHVEQALGTSLLRLQRLVEGSPYAMAMLDRELCYVYASERWVADYGLALTSEQLRGRCHYDVFPEIPDRWKQIHRRCLGGETLQSDADTFTRVDGVVHWLRWQVRPWYDGDRVGGILIFSEDVSARKRAEEELKRAKEQFQLALEAAPTGMLMIDQAGTITLANAQLERLFGYSREELLGKPVEVLVPERLRARHLRQRTDFLRAPQGRPMGAGPELYGLRKDGTELPIEIGLNPLETPDGNFTLSSVVDLTERNQAERERAELLLQREAARRHQERSRFFELSLDLVCIANTSGRFLQLNPAFSSTLGYATEELLSVPFFDFIHPDDLPATQRELERLAAGRATIDFTNRYRCKDGSYRWLQWRAIPDSDGILYAIARDVTSDRELVAALQSRQMSLSASLRERDVLLQEIHHRVKNNLQIIASLINMQLRTLGESANRGALEECQSRVQAIALIHEKLYQAKDYGRVPFAEYARSLAGDIFHTLGASSSQVALQVEIESVFLPVDRAIPCGLILNELLTNALKHAFPAQRRGVVRVELRQASGQELLLVVRDDGIGISADIDPGNTTSIGLQLVSTLVEQLSGRLDVRRDHGTAIRIQFPTNVN